MGARVRRRAWLLLARWAFAARKGLLVASAMVWPGSSSSAERRWRRWVGRALFWASDQFRFYQWLEERGRRDG
jgi:hypothetical protein